MKSAWNRIGKFYKKKTTAAMVIEGPDGNLIQDPEMVAETFASHFQNVSDLTSANPNFARFKNDMERRGIEFGLSNSEYNCQLTMRELEDALKQSDKNTAPGHDGITYEMIDKTDKTYKCALLKLYNKIFLNDSFPMSWKKSILIPIPKEGKDGKYPRNYRPISLTCCLCKLLERVVNGRLSWFLEKTNSITSSQSGFRRYRSSTDHLVQLETAARKAIATKKHMLVIFFDLQKAYDTAWRFNIIRNLHNYGLRGHLLHLIDNFLKNRTFAVRIQNKHSTEKELKDGIPQGSVLSCTLFLVAINEIDKDLPPTIRGGLYVDDFAAWCCGSRLHSLGRQLQLAVKKLEKWSKHTGFTFSMDKTEIMHICRCYGCLKAVPEIELYNQRIKGAETFKYLGLTIDKSLTWRKHIENLRISCTKRMNLLKFLSYKSSSTDRKMFVRLYLALIKTKIDYGVEAYGSACKTLMKSVQPIQNAALRIATGAFRSTPIKSLHAETGLKTLDEYRDIKYLNYLIRLKVNPDPTLINSISDVDENLFPPGGKKPIPFYIRAKRSSEDLNINYDTLMTENPFETPPWRNDVRCCRELWKMTKKDNLSADLRARAIEHIEQKHDEETNIYTDGSKSEAGTGFAMVHRDNTITHKIDSRATIFTAEMYAILTAVQSLNQMNGNEWTIMSDSRSAIQAIMRGNNGHPIASAISREVKNSNKFVKLCWIPSHVGVAGNERADLAAKRALELPTISNFNVPAEDFKCQIKKSINRRRRDQWMNTRFNKLRRIKDIPSPFLSSYQLNRKWEKKLARLRFGHTRLTHEFIMAGRREEPPECDVCQVQVTVEHLLIYCEKYSEKRRRHFDNIHPLNIKSILGETGPVAYNDHLFKFLTETNLMPLL